MKQTRLQRVIRFVIRRLLPAAFDGNYDDFILEQLAKRLRAQAPDLVVVSQGENYDGVKFAEICRREKFPFVLICQKATDQNWPNNEMTPLMLSSFSNAKHSFFVSEHNRRLTEHQIGQQLLNASVVWNPMGKQNLDAEPFPSTEGGFNFACVGRLFAQEKGQDILFKVLAQQEWRARPINLNIYGKGINEKSLKKLPDILGLTNVKFHGHVSDISEVWRDNHALVLPSRCEGLPLSVVEAMHCARPCIVTDVGGNAEVIVDGMTGFIAESASVGSYGEAMERAWTRRAEWEAIGREARNAIVRMVPANPELDFAMQLVEIAKTRCRM